MSDQSARPSGTDCKVKKNHGWLGGGTRVPSPKTSRSSFTFSAICAGSPWTASWLLFCSAATTSRSRETDRSTYMTLHATCSMVGGLDKRPVSRPATLPPRGSGVKGPDRIGYGGWACERIQCQDGPSRKVYGRSAPMAFSGGRRSGVPHCWADATATRYQGETVGRGGGERRMALVQGTGSRRGLRSRWELGRRGGVRATLRGFEG